MAANSNAGSPSVKVVLEGTPTSSSNQIEKVAKEVTEIVKGTLDLDFRKEACTSYVSNSKWYEDADDGSVADACNKYLKAMIETDVLRLNIVKDWMDGDIDQNEAMIKLNALPEYSHGVQLDLFKQ